MLMTGEKCALCDFEPLRDVVIHENELAVAVLARQRLARGHTLIVPRRHVVASEALTDAEVVAVNHLRTPLEAAMRAAIVGETGGIDVWERNRPDFAATPALPEHRQIHLIPSQPGGELFGSALVWSRDRFSELQDTERRAMLELFQGYLVELDGYAAAA